MPISVADALSEPPQTQPGGQSPTPGLSVDSVYTQAPSPSADSGGVSSAVRGAVQGQSQWITNYRDLANAYSRALKDDFTASPETPAAALLQSGKTAIDLLGAAFSPLESAVRTGVINPATAAIDKLGKLVSDHVAADEEWTPQERREAFLAGKKLGQKYPKGIDWKVHKADVARTVEDVNKFVEIGALTGVMMVGPKALSRGPMTVKELEAATAERAAIDAEKAKLPPAGEKPSVITPDKPRMQVTGVDAASGKPRVRVLSPDQASAGVADAMRDVHMEVLPMVRVEPKSSQVLRQFAQDWNQIHAEMSPRYVAAMEEGRPVGAHAILDTMLNNTKGTYQQYFISRLRQLIDDVPVNFKQDVRGSDGAQIRGLYSPRTHDVQVRVEPGSSWGTQVLLHELTHAGTLKWMRSNFNHPLMKEIEDLWAEAKETLEIKGNESHYGLSNAEEFVAEAMANPRFQARLTGVQSKSSTSNMFHRLVDIVRRMFGLPIDQGAFLARVMDTTDKIMYAQASVKRLKGTGAAAEMRVPKIAQPVVDKLKGYTDELIRAVNPEGLGEKAKAAASVIASQVAKQIHRDSVWQTGSRQRAAFWQSNSNLKADFIRRFEKGENQPTRELQSIASHYKLWAREIYQQDSLITGLRYTPKDNYLYHAFEDSEGAADFFTQKYGKKWGDPHFTKDREFELYQEGIQAGFKPKFDNPEELMLARQHASDVAEMQHGILEDMARFGLATIKQKGKAPPANTTPRRSPNGTWYNVDNQAQAVLHNAFDTQSLWSMKGMLGDAFRGAMALKNTIVPIRLALSLFHPLHVLHIDNAAATELAWKEMLGGQRSAVSAMRETGKSLLLYRSLYENPSLGGRLLKVWRGQVPGNALTASDRQSLQFMLEGGFTPEMSSQYRTNARETFMKAVREGSVSATWKAPFALLSAMGKPIFEVWIPNLKAASYLKHAQTALKLDPELATNPLKRQLALRRIAKSVDNRYGEMAYNTLFWKRWLKDLAVANTLSLGWQMGFIREYGGGALDVGQFIKGSDKVQKVKEGLLDRPLFLAAYNTTALGYGGLMTWAMSGQPPQSLTDYVFPQTGETDENGQPQRVNTMFYTREFASISKHMQDQGVISGLGHLASSKASGVLGLAGEWASGVNYFGQEIRDPDAPAYKQLAQTVAYTLADLEPISTQQIGDKTTKEKVLSVAGFSPVAKYLSESGTESAIKQAYGKYVAPQQTPFDKAQYSDDARKLRGLLKRDDPKADDLLEQMAEKYQLSRGDLHRLTRTINRGPPPSVRMFQRLDWRIQKKLLDKMSSEEREIYLPHSNREHLRRRYEEPGE